MTGTAKRLTSKARGARRAFEDFGRNPRASWVLPGFARGFSYADREALLPVNRAEEHELKETAQPSNPLWDFFANRSEGPGIWKWEHYFEIYQRHFHPFVGTQVDLLEIGIYSGGSLDMWASYFGDQCHVYGVDIDPSCVAYERSNVTVLIGDQQDRSFWARVKGQVSGLDIVVDDGGHTPEQQMVTLEELLPHIRPGGVYLCEDVQGIHNDFIAFAAGLVAQLNAAQATPGDLLGTYPTAFQGAIHSIHFYPYVVVIEKNAVPPSVFSAPKHGTEWNPAPYGT